MHIPRCCVIAKTTLCQPWPLGCCGQGSSIMFINDEICLGGAKCKDVCPWQTPQSQTGVGLYLKLAPRLGHYLDSSLKCCSWHRTDAGH